MQSTRRTFFKRTFIAGASLSVPFVWTSSGSHAQQNGVQRAKPKLAAIGVGGSRGAHARGTAIALKASMHAQLVAVCDVDAVHRNEFSSKFGRKLNEYNDYRELLEKERPDVVTIGTPDHWHVPIAIAALRAGCHVFCEKPVTLTIEEGFRIRDEVNASGRIFQVGTQQRSEYGLRFLQAVAIVKSGMLGKHVSADIAIGAGEGGGPFSVLPVPNGLDWDKWIGPARRSEYSHERRKGFRWYYDYSGGKLTDWGAHHVDIAQWALGHETTGPVSVSLAGPRNFTPLVPDNFNWPAYFAGETSLPDGYHTATTFSVRMSFANDSQITVHNTFRSPDGKTAFSNGILFTGKHGRIFVNRERLTGKPVEHLSRADRISLMQAMIEIYKGRWPGDHMHNFFECIRERDEPISDIASHVRTMTSCHLCNIALMLGREMKWNPVTDTFPEDAQAAALLSRHRRPEYSIESTS